MDNKTKKRSEERSDLLDKGLPKGVELVHNPVIGGNDHILTSKDKPCGVICEILTDEEIANSLSTEQKATVEYFSKRGLAQALLADNATVLNNNPKHEVDWDNALLQIQEIFIDTCHKQFPNNELIRNLSSITINQLSHYELRITFPGIMLPDVGIGIRWGDMYAGWGTPQLTVASIEETLNEVREFMSDAVFHERFKICRLETM